LKEILPGYKAQEAFQVADASLKKAGYKMVHSLGHGIGLRDHDFPAGISKKAKWTFKENMCLAIEPAIYTKQFGIRLEDNIVVKKAKPLMLSRAPKELVQL
jgi:Xaa-Pro aminopeptidase